MKARNRKYYSPASIVLTLIVGSVFVSLAIAIAVITIEGIIKYGITTIGVGIIMPIILVLVLMSFGITALFIGGKQIYLWIKMIKTKKNGKDAIAQMVDYKSASFSKNVNTRIRYALVLSYNDGGYKKFTTDYLYDINEFRYLKELENLNIKINGNFVTICEPFPKEIYKLDSTYGIELSFYKQKPVAILLRLWFVFFVLSLVFFIATIIAKDGTYITIAIIILFTIHFPFVIPLAIYLLKWLFKK